MISIIQYSGMKKSTIEIDLPLEDWGRIALIAHREQKTIEETIEFLLERFIAEHGDLPTE